MPPKGWRKNADGQYPQPNKETELVSIDDILFPRATIAKLAKNVSVDNMLAKDSVLAVQRSATVFVSHLMFYARQEAKENDRKTVNAQDIFNALEKTEFGGFVPEVKQRISAYEAGLALKKKQKETKKEQDRQNKKLQDAEGAEDEDADDGDDDEEDVFEDANMSLETKDGAEHEEEEEGEAEVESNPIAILAQEEQELNGDKSDAEPEGSDGEAED